VRLFVPALLAAALAVAPQSGQTVPLRQGYGGQVFKSGVDLVRFDVRVTDANGTPVTDIRPEELEIVENGQTLPLLLFQHITEPPGMYQQAALRALSAEVSSNRGAPRGHLYLLVFDQAHIAPGNELIARRAAETFIKTRVRPSDRIAVVGIPGPGPELGFTADRTRAVAELSKVHAELQRNVKSAGGDLTVHEAYEIASGNDRVVADVLTRQSADLSADIGATTTGAGVTGAVDRGRQRSNGSEEPGTTRRIILENARNVVAAADASARDTLQRLADLIAQYRTVEGRKTVVFFSEGFHQQNVTRELEHVAAAAAQSYAVFYSFDLNRRAGSDISQPATPATPVATEALVRTEPLGGLAGETDGALIIDAASHLDSALAKIADQAQDYYVVGFTPSAAALAARGDYRRVTVRVKRPGATVSARTGYATVKPGSSLDRRRAIDAALAAPFSQQGLRVEYTTYTMRADNAGRSRVILSLEADLPVRRSEDDNADVVFVVRDMRDGRVVASGTDTIPLPDAAADGAATGRGLYRVHFDVPPGAYMMRTVVREPGGLVGSADRKLDVRPVSGPDVSVSDVILSSPGGSLPVRARAYAEDGLSGMIETYGRVATQLDGLDVIATLCREGEQRPIASVKADLEPGVSNGIGVVRRAKFAVPLAAITPGAYVARVKATVGSETIGEVSREVEIEPGRAPAVTPSIATRAADTDPARMNPAEILDGDFVKAARQSLRQSMAPPAGHATKGFDLFATGDYAAAATELAAFMKVDQTQAAVAFVLGWAREATGAHREAIGAWRAAAVIDPKMVPAHLALADAYLRIGEPALAIQAVHGGLAALPDSPELRAKLRELERRE
jgi:VWFA-related protein